MSTFLDMTFEDWQWTVVGLLMLCLIMGVA